MITDPVLAESVFSWLLNQSRQHEALRIDPTGPKIIPATTPVKWAILTVLSTRCFLSSTAIRLLMLEMSYRRGSSAIRRGLQRCEKFGLIEKRLFTKETGILKEQARGHLHYKWRMTSSGKQLVNKPRKNMTKVATTTTLVRYHLEVTKDEAKWASVSEIRLATGKSWSTIRKSLNTATNSSDFRIFKSMKIPGDRHGRYQWALADADTTGWKDSAPMVSPSGKGSSPRRKKINVGTTTGRLSYHQSNLSNSPRFSNFSSALPNGHAYYKGILLMCAPANKPSLIRAVGDLLVNEFATSGKKFSAHDVTTRLRQLELERAKNATRRMPLPISTGTPVEKAETGEIYNAGYKVPKIEHEDVKAIVHDIFNAGGMPNLERIQVSNYWEYDTKANIDAKIAASQVTSTTAPVVAVSANQDPTTGTSGSAYDGSSTI